MRISKANIDKYENRPSKIKLGWRERGNYGKYDTDKYIQYNTLIIFIDHTYPFLLSFLILD